LPASKPKEEELLKQYPEKYALLMAIFYEVIWDPIFFESYSHLTNLYAMFALGTLPEYRGRGIGTKMVLASWEVRRNLSFHFS